MATIEGPGYSADITCPECGSADVDTGSGQDSDAVVCRSCGERMGTVGENRARILASIGKAVMPMAKKEAKKAFKGVKGFKPR